MEMPDGKNWFSFMIVIINICLSVTLFILINNKIVITFCIIMIIISVCSLLYMVTLISLRTILTKSYKVEKNEVVDLNVCNLWKLWDREVKRETNENISENDSGKSNIT